MNLLTRTRDQLILGIWASAPAIGVVLLFLTWPGGVHSGEPSFFDGYNPGYSTPLTAGRVLELFGTVVLVVVGAGMVLGDLWRRPFPRALRKAWTVFIVLAAPFGGLAYWLVNCHGAEPATDVTEAT